MNLSAKMEGRASESTIKNRRDILAFLFKRLAYGGTLPLRLAKRGGSLARMKTKAAVLRQMELPRPYAESRPLSIEEVELDGPGENEVLVQVAGAGLCHSDLSVINGKVEWYEDTKGADEEGVFNIASKDDDDPDSEIEKTSDPEQALPEDWKVVLIDD